MSETYTCPECGADALRIAGYEDYGADRDGRRGVQVPIWYCDECGYEESGVA